MVWYAVDGMDGSGKTTSSDFIRAQLESEGRTVLEITHPNRETRFGRLALKYLQIEGKAAVLLSTLFYILDVLSSLRVKRKIGKQYDDVIFVRYSLAAAYLPDKLVSIGFRVIEAVLPVPDVKIYVDIDPDVAYERIISRCENLEVFETREKLAKTRDKMRLITGSWYVVDNSGTVEETEAQTHEIIRKIRSGQE